ncbi:MAG: hypothetical protein J3Q66DRAFT_436091 [Benniella sp.]|nr:MAG: hypothetical protein J3Q66DRAFT_436091 [Benniella sp.]
MPALTDKVFLPIPIVVLNVFLAIFKFVLLSAVGACFAIYAKYGGEYAKSVGWTRSAGYLDMTKTLWNTYHRKKVPGTVKLALAVGFFTTLGASFLDKGIASLVTLTLQPGPPEKEVILSRQFAPEEAAYQKFAGWNSVVPSNDNAVNTMRRTLNSSIAIHNRTDGHTYTPVISDYSVTCADFEVQFLGEQIKTGGCGSVDLGIVGETGAGPGQFLTTKRSPNRWSIVMSSQFPGMSSYTMQDTSLGAGYRTSSPGCEFPENYIHGRYITKTWGVTEFPRASTIKCFLDDGNITVMAMTTTRFNLDSETRHSEVVDTMFAKPLDEMLLAMKETIKTKTIPPTPGQPSQNATRAEIWIEVRVINSTIDIHICGSAAPLNKDLSEIGYECLYGTINVLQFRAPRNERIAQSLGSSFENFGLASYMTLEYVPNILSDGTFDPVSPEKMRNDTADMTKYMAELGYNFYADFKGRTLYIQYEVAKLRLGLEVPFWVIVVAGTILLIGLCVWQLTHWLVGSPHTSSLYSIIRARLASKSNTSVPKLMRFRFQPLMLENVKLLPDEAESSCEAESDVVSIYKAESKYEAESNDDPEDQKNKTWGDRAV